MPMNSFTWKLAKEACSCQNCTEDTSQSSSLLDLALGTSDWGASANEPGDLWPSELDRLIRPSRLSNEGNGGPSPADASRLLAPALERIRELPRVPLRPATVKKRFRHLPELGRRSSPRLSVNCSGLILNYQISLRVRCISASLTGVLLEDPLPEKLRQGTFELLLFLGTRPPHLLFRAKWLGLDENQRTKVILVNGEKGSLQRLDGILRTNQEQQKRAPTTPKRIQDLHAPEARRRPKRLRSL